MKKPLLRQLIMLSKRIFYAFTVQLIFCTVLLASSGNAQRKTIDQVQVSVKAQEVALGKVFSQIERQTDFRFTYNPNAIPLNQLVNLEMEQGTVYQFLEGLIRQTNLSFVQINDNIHVKPLGTSEKGISIQDVSFIEIKGRVTDASGLALPGVTVMIEGTSTGTVTDVDGNYTISASEGDVLVFSFVGFESNRIAVGNQTVINVQLAEDAQALEEVVVVGYGTQKRKNLTGSISSIDQKSLKEFPVSSVEQALQGNAAGVLVSQTGGSPGAAVSVRVRGVGSINGSVEPLYVIDGVPVENAAFGGSGDATNPQPGNSPLAMLNPGDIESIEVLKDASATAIYGARGANGVVLITTKRGESGKSTVIYDGYVGLQEPTNTFDVLNAREYMELQNEFALNDNEEIPYPNIDQIVSQIGEGTNWQNEFYRVAVIQNHQISVSGGSDKTKFFISGNYFSQEGIVPNNGFERISFRTNLDHQISDKFTTGFSFTLSNFKNNNLPGGGAGASPLRNVLTFSPLVPVRNEEGLFEDFIDPNSGAFISNPIGMVNEVTNTTNTFRPIGNLYLDYFITDNLKFKSSLGLDFRFQNGEFYLPRSVQRGRELGGRAGISYDNRTNTVWENTLNYNKVIDNKHQFDVLLGQMVQTSSRTSRSFGAQNFPNDVLGANVIENGEVFERPSSNIVKWAIISYLGRVNYGFDDRYLLTLTMRADGSSRFGTNRRFGYFPSGAFAWRFINEDFIPKNGILSDGKLRISYGVNGNQDGIGAYDRFARLASRDFAYAIGAGNSFVQGFAPVSIANVNLGWEETRQLNIGANIGLWNNRVSLEADYFIKNTSDLLFAVPLPTSAFVGSDVIRNIGELRNSGFELLINADVIQKPDFNWNINFNISSISNEIISLPDGNDITYFSLLGASNIGILREGASFPSFYGWIADGIFASQEEVNDHFFINESGDRVLIQPNAQAGDVRYRDLSGPEGVPDGRIGTEDRTIIGSSLPDFFGGIRNQFSYKNFTFSFFMNFSVGNDVVNYNRWQLANVNRGINQLAEVKDRWTPQNTNTSVPAARSQRSAENAIDSRFVEDGSFLRLRDVTLNYRLSGNALQKIGAQTANFYLKGSNLLTFTRYTGIDPEANSFNPNSSNLAGIEVSAYPMVRMFTAGITVQF
ncbi:SusC/RagA family TonB-linked outer membrane protein [Algoriphagus faecimaris]|nr:TonB-dependent receptor [Algoriphagus faecimaris]